jgi:DNA-nicking Smr family endonuclease
MIDDETSKQRSFAELMTGVKKISDDRINIYRDRAKKTVLPKAKIQTAKTELDYSNINFELISNIKDSHFDSGIQKKLQRKIRQGQLPIEDQIDLHGFNQKQATAALTAFLHHAVSVNFKLIVIIHGKGDRSGSEAVLKPLARHWLAQQSAVLAWCPAQTKHGGGGASYVYLRVQR